MPLSEDVDGRGRDATDEEVLYVGESEGEGDPKSLLVEENNREGSRRLFENLHEIE
jgi:hypothetical protein